MTAPNIPDFALFAATGHIVASDGVDNAQFELAARVYAEANGVHVEFVENGPARVARLNRGFPLGVEPFSPEAKTWAGESPIYQDQSARWKHMWEGRGC